MSEPQVIRLDGTEYVIVPRADYLKLRESAGIPPRSVDAREYVRASLAASLRAARKQAKLTQADLAKRMGVSQPMVSGAEGGSVRVSERYVRNVLEACGLPEDWSASKPKRRSKTGG